MKTENKTRKIVPLCGNSEAHVNLFTGENIIKFTDIVDKDMGVTVSHIMHQNGNEENPYCCGPNMRLNLYETFVKNTDSSVDADYVYTDCMGDTYAFKEYYNYTNTSGIKNRVSDKSNVVVLEDGTLIYKSGSNIYPVKREVVTYDGLKASTKLEGVKNVKFYEQRVDELKQAEEQCDSYKRAFSDYVICDENGNVNIEITTPSFKSIKEFAEKIKQKQDNELVLTRGEAANLKYLCESRSTVEEQSNYKYLEKVTKTNTREIDDTVRALNFNSSKNETTVLYTLERLYDYVIYDISADESNAFSSIVASIITDNIISLDDSHLINGTVFDTYYQEGTTMTKFVLHRNEKANYFSNLAQFNSINSQINLYKDVSAQNVEKIEKAIVDFADSEEAVKKLKLQVPVNFIMSENNTKGFNENGDLVVIYNKRGDYIAIDYENYYVGDQMCRRICKVYDKNERTIAFAYNHKNLLSEITDSKGRTVKYTYTGNEYYNVFYPNGYIFKFYFSNGNVRITDSNTSRYLMNVSDNRVYEIIRFSNIGRVYHGGFEANSDGYAELSRTTFLYDSRTYSTHLIITVTDSEANAREIYVMDNATERLAQYFEEKDGVVVNAELYEFYDSSPKEYVTTKAKRETLYQRPFSEFTFEKGDYIQRKVSIFNYLTEEKEVVYEGDIVKIATTQYEYTPDDRVRCTKTTHTVKKFDAVKEQKDSITLYEYSKDGDLLAKKSYVEGEEATNGISIEEYAYDENGNRIKTVMYNSLDPSSKFYTEKEFDKDGKEINCTDSTGNYKTHFVYDSHGVSSKIYPNGACMSFGTSDVDQSSAITISTENGEENSIQALRTNGLVTKVISGETEYTFEYDKKGRKTLVKQGDTVLAQLSYEDGEYTHRTIVTEKSTATMTTIDRGVGGTDILARDTDNSSSAVLKNYDSRNRLSTLVEDLNASIAHTTYTYDSLDRLTSCERVCDELTSREDYAYDIYGNVSSKTVTNVNGTETYNYEYSTDLNKRLKTVTMSSEGLTIVPKKDSLGRSTGKKIGTVIDDTISYVKYGSHATNMPSSITYKDGTKISYKYDSMGNIVKVYENGVLVTEYEYDAVGRLVRDNTKRMGTKVFKYDNKGNILTNTYYSYSRKPLDELEEEEGSAIELVYDDNGMLTGTGDFETMYIADGRCGRYKGNDVAWEGKEMIEYGLHTFTYDAKGRRIFKDNIQFTYDVCGRLIKQSNGIKFVYDHEALIGFKHGGNTYYYRKDPFGNVVAILDNEGCVVVKYIYDAWGNHKVFNPDGTENTSTTFIGNINPYRYRGYYFDTDVSRNCVPEKIKEITADIRGANSK